MSNPKDYTVGWICALPTEYLAAQEFLDEEHDRPESLPAHSKNDYTLGKIGGHNVAIATMPIGEYGIASAARVAEEMLHSFPNIRVGLMVGIGGGAPSTQHDIRLGDIVVSIPGNGHGGVLQFDFGKTIQGQSFQLTGYLDQPPTVLRTAVAGLKTQYERKGHHLDQAVDDILAKNRRLVKKYKRPDPATDILYQSDHTSDNQVGPDSDSAIRIWREQRSEDEDNPMIHYGLIASSNSLMKDAHARDKLSLEKDILCFEMEAAGLMNNFPCLVIRGICDYSDSHKNEEWQGYAAMVAAAYAKDVLKRIIPRHIEAEKKISEVLAAVNEIRDDTKEIRSTTNDTFELVTDLRSSKEKWNRQRITEWLTPIDYTLQQSDLVSRCQKGTGLWFLATEEFQHWLTSPAENGQNTLFCPGIPGAGKTMIMSTVISHLQHRFRDDAGVGIAYIFCSFRQQEQQTPYNLIASLLRQLSKNRYFEPTEKLYNIKQAACELPSLEDLLATLHSTMAMYSRVIVLVDALDEYQADGDCENFLKNLFHLQSQCETLCSIFATSRYNHLIEALFAGASQRMIRADETDVRKYIDMKIQNFKSKVSIDRSLGEEIKTKITGVVDGMFLLAKLYIDTLAAETTPKGIRRALTEWEIVARDSKPSSKQNTALLDHAYEIALQRIEHQKLQHRDLARKVLSWVIYAKRNLTPLELQHAVAVEIGMPEFDRENIADLGLSVSVCGGLVIIDQQSHAVRLVHSTTQEYLERTWNDRFPKSQDGIAKACVSYLSLKVFDSGACMTQALFQHRLSFYPLYQYASHQWGYHAKETSMETDPSVWNLLRSDQLIAAYSQALIYSRDKNETFPSVCGMTSLHIAAFFGFSTLTWAVLKCNAEIDTKDNVHGMTPLMWAAVHGSYGVAKVLVDGGAEIESTSSRGPNRYRNALCLAIENGHEAMVKLLLDRGGSKSFHVPFIDWAFISAGRQGYAGIIKLLLDTKEDLAKSFSFMENWAMRGHQEVLRLLIDRGIDEATLADAMCYAAKGGQEKLVKFWLDRCVGREQVDWRMRMNGPLCSAAESGYEPIVRLLLRRGADPEAKNSEGSAIGHAARNGHAKVVKLLLEYKASVKGDNDILALAVKGGNEEVVRLLLDHGANMQSNKTTATPNLLKRVERLVAFNTGAPAIRAEVPIIRKMWDKTPLICAISLGLPRIVTLLVDRGADVERRNGLGQTPLAISCELGQEGIVRLLLNKGAKIDRMTFQEVTPLMIAAGLGHVDVVRALLDHRAKIETRGHQGLTALTAAIRGGHEKVVELLVQHKASVTQRGFQENTPLILAVDHGNQKILQLLRDSLTERPLNGEDKTASGSEEEPWEGGYFLLKKEFELWDRCVQDALSRSRQQRIQ